MLSGGNYVTVIEHEKTNGRRECCLDWREFERYLTLQESIENLLGASIKGEFEKLYNILKRITDVTLFLGERSLPFHGSS